MTIYLLAVLIVAGIAALIAIIGSHLDKKKKAISYVVVVTTCLAGSIAVYVNGSKPEEPKPIVVQAISSPAPKLTDSVSKLMTGISLKSVEPLFPPPTIERRLDPPHAQYRERIYVDPLCFVQVVTDKENTVVFYAVTARDEKFKPALPKDFVERLESKAKTLGEIVFSDIDPQSVMSVYADGSSSHKFYEEQYYAIRDENMYFLAASPSGYLDMSANWDELLNLTSQFQDREDAPFGYQESTMDERWQKYLRETLRPRLSKIKPNTFAVANIYLDKRLMKFLYQDETRSGIGANYFEVLKFDR